MHYSNAGFFSCPRPLCTDSGREQRNKQENNQLLTQVVRVALVMTKLGGGTGALLLGESKGNKR